MIASTSIRKASARMSPSAKRIPALEIKRGVPIPQRGVGPRGWKDLASKMTIGDSVHDLTIEHAAALLHALRGIQCRGTRRKADNNTFAVWRVA